MCRNCDSFEPAVVTDLIRNAPYTFVAQLWAARREELLQVVGFGNDQDLADDLRLCCTLCMRNFEFRRDLRGRVRWCLSSRS